MTHRRITNVGYAALVTFGCAVAVWTGILTVRPAQTERGYIALETKPEQRPPKPRMISIVGKRYLSLAELDAESVRRMDRTSRPRERGD